MAVITVGFNPAIDRILECPDFHIGGHQTVRQVARLAAGKAANVSRALALLGTDSIASGFVGTEELEFFHTELMATGPGRILCHFIEVQGRTRENISILDSARAIETHLRDRGFGVSEPEKNLLAEKLTHDTRPGDLVIFAGSLCEGVDLDFFNKLIESCHTAGARVAVDTSGPALREAVERNVYLIKPNLLELRQLLQQNIPDDPAAIRAAVQPLNEKVANVLISRGANGAMLVSRAASFTGRVESFNPVVRTVGCGDHLLAAFISELQGGRHAATALRVALAVATARATSTHMADFDRAEVKAALASAEVVPLDAT